MRWLIAASVSAALFAAVSVSTLVPYQDEKTVDYVFVWAGAHAELIAAATAALLVVVLWMCVRVVARRAGVSGQQDARSGRWLAPLAAAGAIALGILPAVPGIGQRAAPFAYFFIDLRWWWMAVLAILTARRLDHLFDHRLSRRLSFLRPLSAGRRLRMLDALVFTTAVGWAIVTTHAMRFSAFENGDEPKYVRYCENWYQGLGVDLTGFTWASAQPPGRPPQLARLAQHVASGIRRDAIDLTRDLAAFVRGPASFRWNRASGSNGIVIGKHGGIYEVYQPGLSVLLFPGYAFDRYVFRDRFSYGGQFAGTLYATNAIILLFYGGTALALFRLFRHGLGNDLLAWSAAVASVITLPLTALAFQFYPEVTAAFFIAVVTNYVLFHAKASGRLKAFAAGTFAGYLFLLHPRFVAVAIVLAAAALIRSNTRARRWFAISFAALLFTWVAYNYHITGSWSPDLYAIARDTPTLHFVGVPLNVVAYFFHRLWGVAPHEPILLGLLAGFVAVWAESPVAVMVLAIVMLSLVIPAASHSLSAAGTTPDRLIAAIMPLAAWPIAAALRRLWRFTSVRAAAVILLVLSLQSAAVFNWHFEKGTGLMHDASVSGWKANLAFPAIRGEAWDVSRSNFIVLLILSAFVIGLAIWMIARIRWDRSRAIVRGRVHADGMTIALTFALSVGSATLLTAAEGQWTRGDYLLDRSTAQRRAQEAMVALDRCRVCFSANRGQLDWTRFPSMRVSVVDVSADVSRADVVIRIQLAGTGPEPRVGRARADFGDGSVSNWLGVVDQAEIPHRYRMSGTFTLLTWVELYDGTRKVDRQTIDIAPIAAR